MDFDWAVSLVVFLLFISWAIGLYTTTFAPKDPFQTEDASLGIGQRIADALSAEVAVVNLNSSSANSSYTLGRNVTFSFNFSWPYGKNTTRLYLNDVSIPCWMNANNDTVYFFANASAGSNYYTMRYRNESTTMNCTSSFAIQNETAIIPWPEVRRTQLSATRINQFNSTSYEQMRDNLSINRPFQVEFNISGALTTYGPALPPATNTYVTTVRDRVEETGDNATIRIAVW